MKKIAGAMIIVLFIFHPAYAAGQTAEEQILEVLARQKGAWNRGDIEGFMAYYWKSTDMTFQSGNSRLEGWEALLERYRKNYSGANMGTLDFTDTVIRMLSAETALVLGRWKLGQESGGLEGLFTLILQRREEGWRIIHDHTSS